MKHLIQPNRWSCLPTAFAMVLNVEIEDIIKFCGHDGSLIPEAWKDLPEPLCRQSFSISEIIDYALLYTEYSICKIDIYPVSIALDSLPEFEIYNEQTKMRRLDHYLSNYKGVLIGVKSKNIRHAMAYENSIIYDPNGNKYNIQDQVNFKLQSFYLVIKSENKKII